MKRFLIGLLAVGLIAALSMPVLAADIKVSGEYFAAGYWESNRALKSSSETAQRYYGQRLQVNPVIQVAEGLKLVTRFDALVRVWGQDPIGTSATRTNTRNTAEEQNISWRRAYISAKILGGILDVGYQSGGPWGTDFMDYENDCAAIKYVYPVGPWAFVARTEKAFSTGFASGGGEKSLRDGTSSGDYDKYALAAVYKWSGGNAGALVQKYVLNNPEQGNPGYNRDFNLWSPYFKATLGPVYLEGEIIYVQGKFAQYRTPGYSDIDIKNFDWYLNAKYTMGPAYIGGSVAIIQGDDPSTADKYENAPFDPENGWTKYQPTLVLWNDWTSRWTGQNFGSNSYGVQKTGLPTNANIYQIYAGFKPMAKLSIDAAYSFLKANEKNMGNTSYATAPVLSDDYGKEFDIKAAYKIYDNLEYCVAFGYLWTGDFFKGTDSANTVGNDWLLMHKLTLTF